MAVPGRHRLILMAWQACGEVQAGDAHGLQGAGLGAAVPLTSIPPAGPVPKPKAASRCITVSWS